MIYYACLTAIALALGGCAATSVETFETPIGAGYVVTYAGNGVTVPLTVIMVPDGRGGHSPASAGGQSLAAAAMTGAVGSAIVGGSLIAAADRIRPAQFPSSVGLKF